MSQYRAAQHVGAGPSEAFRMDSLLVGRFIIDRQGSCDQTGHTGSKVSTRTGSLGNRARSIQLANMVLFPRVLPARYSR